MCQYKSAQNEKEVHREIGASWPQCSQKRTRMESNNCNCRNPAQPIKPDVMLCQNPFPASSSQPWSTSIHRAAPIAMKLHPSHRRVPDKIPTSNAKILYRAGATS